MHSNSPTPIQNYSNIFPEVILSDPRFSGGEGGRVQITVLLEFGPWSRRQFLLEMCKNRAVGRFYFFIYFSKSRFEGRYEWGIDNTRGERVPKFNNSAKKLGPDI